MKGSFSVLNLTERPGFAAFAFALAYPFALLACVLPLAVWLDLRTHLLAGKVAETLAVLGLTWVFLTSEGRSLAEISGRLRRLRPWSLGLAWGAGLQIGSALVLWGAGSATWTPGQWEPWTWLHAILLLAVVAIHEEFLFRGYPFQRLVTSWGFWPAVITFSGLLFALVHLMNPNQTKEVLLWSLLNITLAGLLFGAMWRATGSLAMPIAAHFGWNVLQGPVLGFGVSGNALPSLLSVVPNPNHPLWLHGGRFGLEATLPCAVLCGSALIWFATRPAASEKQDTHGDASCPEPS